MGMPSAARRSRSSLAPLRGVRQSCMGALPQQVTAFSRPTSHRQTCPDLRSSGTVEFHQGWRVVSILFWVFHKPVTRTTVLTNVDGSASIDVNASTWDCIDTDDLVPSHLSRRADGGPARTPPPASHPPVERRWNQSHSRGPAPARHARRGGRFLGRHVCNDGGDGGCPPRPHAKPHQAPLILGDSVDCA